MGTRPLTKNRRGMRDRFRGRARNEESELVIRGAVKSTDNSNRKGGGGGRTSLCRKRSKGIEGWNRKNVHRYPRVFDLVILYMCIYILYLLTIAFNCITSGLIIYFSIINYSLPLLPAFKTKFEISFFYLTPSFWHKNITIKNNFNKGVH